MLRRLREDKGLSQDDLARLIKVSRPTITRAENGSVTVKTAKKLAKVFCVEWTVFFEEKRTENAQNRHKAS